MYHKYCAIITKLKFLIRLTNCDENLKFTKDLLIGAASSAYQVEGGWNASGNIVTDYTNTYKNLNIKTELISYATIINLGWLFEKPNSVSKSTFSDQKKQFNFQRILIFLLKMTVRRPDVTCNCEFFILVKATSFIW